MLTIGTGIGGGLIVDGEVYRGSTGAAGELGHIVIEADGPPCQGNCPNRGCVESLASGTAIAARGPRSGGARARTRRSGGRSPAAPSSTAARSPTPALEGDEAARGVLALAGRRIGVALSSLANMLRPRRDRDRRRRDRGRASSCSARRARRFGRERFRP